MTTEFVILDVNGHFWTGTNWHPEYPEACIYDKLNSAREAATKLTRAYLIVTRYGLASEVRFSLWAGHFVPQKGRR